MPQKISIVRLIIIGHVILRRKALVFFLQASRTCTPMCTTRCHQPADQHPAKGSINFFFFKKNFFKVNLFFVWNIYFLEGNFIFMEGKFILWKVSYFLEDNLFIGKGTLVIA